MNDGTWSGFWRDLTTKYRRSGNRRMASERPKVPFWFLNLNRVSVQVERRAFNAEAIQRMV